MSEDISARALHDAARMACRALSLEFREAPSDGLFRRLTAGGERKDGGLKLFEHGQGGIAWNFSTGEHRLFFVDGGPAELTEAERRKLKRLQRERRAEAEKELTAASVLAAARARRLWKRAGPVKYPHVFLTGHGVGPKGLRQLGTVLVVPVTNAAGELISLQMIAPDGAWRFLRGSQIAGGYHVLGDDKAASALIIAEGLTAAAGLHEATGHPTIIAFSASNIPFVTELWRQKLPEARIVIAANADGQDGGPGATNAREAAAKFGGVVAIPDFAAAERRCGDADFNDLARLRGFAEVKRQIEAAFAASVSRLRKVGAYEATDCGLYWNRETREGGVDRQRLANFCAWIAGERIEDDGAEPRGLLDIEATIHGRTVRFPIPTEQLHRHGLGRRTYRGGCRHRTRIWRQGQGACGNPISLRAGSPALCLCAYGLAADRRSWLDLSAYGWRDQRAWSCRRCRCGHGGIAQQLPAAIKLGAPIASPRLCALRWQSSTSRRIV